jgi:16S rRNA processing protein RimM
VHDFGAGDTLEIARAEGPPVMVPFTRAIVPVVDLAAGRVVLDPPPGLIDEPVSKRRAIGKGADRQDNRDDIAAEPAR